MQSNLAESGAKFYYVDSYGPLADMIHDHRKYGEQKSRYLVTYKFSFELKKH